MRRSCTTCTRDLLGQLPRGPVQELCLYAPFVDQTGQALAEIFDWFDPGRVVIGLQEHWTSYDGDAVLRAAGHRQVEIRLLPERFPRHGKLLEWQADDSRHALTGSANLTRSALTRATADGGNCELAVLTPVGASLMPEGICVAAAHLQGRRTVSEITPAPAVLLLGALLTRAGLVVTLARAYDVDVTIETSPDGSPGSWTGIGTVPAGQDEAVFPLSGWAGAAVRAVAVLAGTGRAESPPVFTVDPARCARRQADDHRPRLQHSYTEEEIFTDDGASPPVPQRPAAPRRDATPGSGPGTRPRPPPAGLLRRPSKIDGLPTWRTANAASVGRSPSRCSDRCFQLMPRTQHRPRLEHRRRPASR